MAVERGRKGVFVRIDAAVVVIEVTIGMLLLLLWGIVGFKFGWEWLLNLFLLKSAPLHWDIPIFTIFGYRIVPLNLLILITIAMLLISLIGAAVSAIPLGKDFYLDAGVLFYDLSIATIGYWYAFTSIPPAHDAILGILLIEVAVALVVSFVMLKPYENRLELRWSCLPLYLTVGVVSAFHPFLLAANLAVGLLVADIVKGVRYASKHRTGFRYVAGLEVVNDVLYVVPTLPMLIGMIMVFPWT